MKIFKNKKIQFIINTNINNKKKNSWTVSI